MSFISPSLPPHILFLFLMNQGCIFSKNKDFVESTIKTLNLARVYIIESDHLDLIML